MMLSVAPNGLETQVVSSNAEQSNVQSTDSMKGQIEKSFKDKSENHMECDNNVNTETETTEPSPNPSAAEDKDDASGVSKRTAEDANLSEGEKAKNLKVDEKDEEEQNAQVETQVEATPSDDLNCSMGAENTSELQIVKLTDELKDFSQKASQRKKETNEFLEDSKNRTENVHLQVAELCESVINGEDHIVNKSQEDIEKSLERMEKRLEIEKKWVTDSLIQNKNLEQRLKKNATELTRKFKRLHASTLELFSEESELDFLEQTMKKTKDLLKSVNTGIEFSLSTSQEIQSNNDAFKELTTEISDLRRELELALTSKRFKLNVGGSFFETTWGTLIKFPESKLCDVFRAVKQQPIESRIFCVKDKDDVYFFDRNPELFKEILEFLRNPDTYKTSFRSDEYLNDVMVEKLFFEAKYFGLSKLVKLLGFDEVSFPVPAPNDESEEFPKGIFHYLATKYGTQSKPDLSNLKDLVSFDTPELDYYFLMDNEFGTTINSALAVYLKKHDFDLTGFAIELKQAAKIGLGCLFRNDLMSQEFETTGKYIIQSKDCKDCVGLRISAPRAKEIKRFEIFGTIRRKTDF